LHQQDQKVLVVARNHPDDLPGEDVQFQACDVTTNDPANLSLPDDLRGLAYFPGSIRLRPFNRLDVEEFEQDWDINVGGAIRVLQAAADSLKNGEERAGVVLVSTVATRVGLKFHTSVAAAKAALEGLAQSLAAEWAPDVAVNVLAPSLTDSPMAEDLLKSDRKRERSIDRHPLEEINEPEELAEIASKLMMSDWNMSGEVIGVDGGLANVRSR
jgi:NAD(P)-dependent dehydrogenase (short-subunit alcohol dehydrogenase family)